MSWQASARKVEAAIGGLSIEETLKNGTQAFAYCPGCRVWRAPHAARAAERLTL